MYCGCWLLIGCYLLKDFAVVFQRKRSSETPITQVRRRGADASQRWRSGARDAEPAGRRLRRHGRTGLSPRSAGIREEAHTSQSIFYFY